MANKTKCCCRCHRELPVEMFNGKKKSEDGLQAHCKVCQIEITRVHRDGEKLKLIRKLIDMLEPYRKEKIGDDN